MARNKGLEVTALLVVLILLIASIVHLSQYTELSIPFQKESESYFQLNETKLEKQYISIPTSSITTKKPQTNIVTDLDPNREVLEGPVIVYDNGKYFVVQKGTILTDGKLIKASQEGSSVLYLKN